ncbi:hypothetical protein LTR94_026638, partial [Friedmanniomyces endolithicus]
MVPAELPSLTQSRRPAGALHNSPLRILEGRASRIGFDSLVDCFGRGRTGLPAAETSNSLSTPKILSILSFSGSLGFGECEKRRNRKSSVLDRQLPYSTTPAEEEAQDNEYNRYEKENLGELSGKASDAAKAQKGSDDGDYSQNDSPAEH